VSKEPHILKRTLTYFEISTTYHLREKDGRARLPRGLPSSKKSSTLSQKRPTYYKKNPERGLHIIKRTPFWKEPPHILKSALHIIWEGRMGEQGYHTAYRCLHCPKRGLHIIKRTPTYSEISPTFHLRGKDVGDIDCPAACCRLKRALHCLKRAQHCLKRALE